MARIAADDEQRRGGRDFDLKTIAARWSWRVEQAFLVPMKTRHERQSGA